MATVNRFEDLEVWNLERSQCNEVYTWMRTGAFKEDGDLRGQMNRSSASVMDNIGEGLERFTRADFRHYLVLAKGSNGEMRSQIHRMADRNLVPFECYQWLITSNELLGRKLYAFIKYPGRSNYKDKGGIDTHTPVDAREVETPYKNRLRLNLPQSFNQFYYENPDEFLLKP